MKLLARRIDWLCVAFRVELTEELLGYLKERAEVAREHGRADVALVTPSGHSLALELRRSRAEGRWYLENSEVRVLVDEFAPGRHLDPVEAERAAHDPRSEPARTVPGWTVEVTAHATFLATAPLAAVLDVMRETAGGFGPPEAERLRRFDLAADFAGWELSEADLNGWCKHGRTKLVGYFGAHVDDLSEQREKELDEAEKKGWIPVPTTIHHAKAKFSGFTVGQGGPVRLRVYDKTKELEDQGTDQKRAIEAELWSKGGWDGVSRVVRVEYQVRGEALDEMSMRDPQSVESKCDSVWHYLTHRWCRLVEPDSASRLSRCTVDVRWLAAQAVRFFHDPSPLRRVRCRGVCSFEQLFGSMASYLAGEGLTEGLALELRKAGPEKQFAWNMSEPEAADYVRHVAGELGNMVAAAFATRWLRTPHKSVEHIAAVLRAYQARFSQGPPGRRPPLTPA